MFGFRLTDKKELLNETSVCCSQSNVLQEIDFSSIEKTIRPKVAPTNGQNSFDDQNFQSNKLNLNVFGTKDDEIQSNAMLTKRIKK